MLRALSLSFLPRSSSSLAALVAASALAVACGGAEEPPAAPPPPPPPPPPPAVIATTPPPASAATPPPEPPKPAAPTPVFKIADLAAPESVLYDEARDRYLVSNVNGTPFDADNNGFIAEVSPEGKVTTMKWIEGGKNKVTLNAPKGMAIVKDVLYVADINTVRMFDAKTGKPKGEVKLPGATFANDIAASDDGSKIYVTDSGLKPEGQGFGATGTDSVWLIEGGKAKSFAKSTDLEKPNGVIVDGKTLLIAPFGGAEIYRLDEKGKKTDVTKTPKGMLDGIFKLGDDVYVSSWEGSAIYKGKVGGTFEAVFSDLKSPADIGFDKKHRRVLVPHMMENTVEAFDIK